MDRARGRARATKKRVILTSHQDSDPITPSTPPVHSSTSNHHTPTTATQRGGKSKSFFPLHHHQSSPSAELSRDRPVSRTNTFPSTSTSFTFETPSQSGANMAPGPSSRKRARTFEQTYDGAADDEAVSKGGHSLRKRARIDYTQSIDDAVATTSRGGNGDIPAKPITTPSARAIRRRKESEEDLIDDAATTGKRRRSEIPPPNGRHNSVKRRLGPEANHGITQFGSLETTSDNEIHESITVSVPTGENAPSTDESDSSSFPESDSRPSTSDSSDIAPAQTQPGTPQPQVVPQVEDAVTLATETAETVEKGLMPRQPNEAEMTPNDIQPATQPDESKPQDSVKNVTSEPAITQVGNIETPEQAADTQSLGSQGVEEPPAPSPVSKMSLQVPSSTAENQTTQPATTPEQVLAPKAVEKPLSQEGVATTISPDLEHPTGSLDVEMVDTPEPTESLQSLPASDLHNQVEAPKSLEAPEPLEQLHPTPTPPVPGPSKPSQAELPPQPPRLRRLVTLYVNPTRLSALLNLTPYEDEDVQLPGPYLEKPKAVESTMPTPAPTPSNGEFYANEIHWDFLRPLKNREFFELYRQEKKRREARGESPVSMKEFHNYCVRKYKAAHSQNGDLVESPAVVETTKKVKKGRKRPALAASASFDETPQGSQAADSRQATAAPSPAPIDEATATGKPGSGENEPEADDGVEENPEPTGVAEPVETVQIPSKQYSFPKIRDPSEFMDALASYQEMDSETLYKTVAAAVEALTVWEKEYHELRKIVDDEENAKRRLPNDKAIENWEKRQRPDEPESWRRHFDEAYKGPPAFELKGVRVQKPFIDDPVLERQKENDKVMAQAYGFKYSSHPAQVGRQNPEEQRWEMTERGLRDRKKTEKAAELAEENVIEGKRARKPRNLSDQSKDPSRSGTPIGSVALGVGRRARRKPGAGPIHEDETNVSKQATDGDFLAGPIPRKRRGPRPRAELLAEQEEPVVPIHKKTDDDATEGKQTAARKRGPPPTSVPTEMDEYGLQQRPSKKPASEIASSSFYSNPSSTNTQPESRPSTASSEATAHATETGESAYSLRDKRKRNFALENDPELEPRAKKARSVAAPTTKQDNPEPKKRGPRKKNATTQALALPPPPPAIAPQPQPVGGLKAPAMFFNHAAPPVLAPPGPFIHTFNTAAPVFPPNGAAPRAPEPPEAKKQIRIKLTTGNGQGSQGPSRTPTPANIAPNPATKSTGKTSRGAKPAAPSELDAPQLPGSANTLNGEPEKLYAEMSKSEKMSYSMRRK